MGSAQLLQLEQRAHEIADRCLRGRGRGGVAADMRVELHAGVAIGEGLAGRRIRNPRDR